MPLHISPHLVRLIGRVPVNAAVRTFRVIEPNGLFDRFDYLLQASKRLSVKEFVLDSIVDAFGHCIVFRVAALGHAWRNVVQSQMFYVLRAGVLGTAVGVVDEGVGKAFGQRGYGFLQSYYAVFSFKRRSHTTAQDAFAVGIHDKCQEAEAVAKSGRLVFYRHIGYVTDPYLVGTYREGSRSSQGSDRSAGYAESRSCVGHEVAAQRSARAREGYSGTRRVPHGTLH